MNESNPKNMRSLFNNEKFLFVFSLLLSFIIWTAIAANSGEIVSYTVPGVPVNLELSEEAAEDGLTVVSVDGIPVQDFNVSVKVTGNSVTVGSLTSTDIDVYGSNIGNIVTSGTYNVTLAARSAGVKSNYSIQSVNPGEVTLVVDRNVTKTFDIQSQITASSPAEYYMGNQTFSSKAVSVQGPEQSVSKVAYAVVTGNVDKEITETLVMKNQPIILLDSNGNVIEDDSLVTEPAMVDVTIPVLTKKTVPIELICENKPAGLAIDNFVSIDPAEIEIAATEDVIDSINSITIGPLDFNKLDFGTEYTNYEIVMPEGVRNLNNITSAKVQFNFNSLSSIKKQITAFKFINIPEGLSAQYSPYSSIQVRIIGPKDELDNLKTSDIEATLDLSEAKVGTSDTPVTITINGMTSCWVYGSYSINVTVYESGDSEAVQSGFIDAETNSVFEEDTDMDHEN